MTTPGPKPQPVLSLAPHPDVGLGVQGYLHHAQRTYLMHWGDGTVEKLAPSTVRRHTYPEAGAYTISAGYEGEAILSRALVFVREGLEPQLAMQESASNANIWELYFNETKRQLISWYQVNWGDNTGLQEIAGPQGSKTEHGYRDGTYTVAVQDQGTRRWWRHEITVAAPAQDPDFTWTYVDSDPSGMTVEFELKAKQAGKTVRLYWNEDGLTQEFTEIGEKHSHKYKKTGGYIVQAVYTDSTGDGAAWGVDVPDPKKKHTKPASQLLISVDLVNPLATWTRWAGSITDYDLHFGDGESTRRLWWQPPVKHTYPGKGRYLVKGENDLGHTEQEWIELGQEPPPPPVVVPEFRGGALAAGVKWPAGVRGQWRVDWPDWEPETLTPVAEEWVERATLPGSRLVKATFLETEDNYEETVAVTNTHNPDTDFTVNVNGKTVQVKRTAPENPEGGTSRNWYVAWGDEWSDAFTNQVPKRPTYMSLTTMRHTYQEPGRYFVEMFSPARDGSSSSRVYTRMKEVVIDE